VYSREKKSDFLLSNGNSHIMLMMHGSSWWEVWLTSCDVERKVDGFSITVIGEIALTFGRELFKIL
jgi:hypothetical protein